MTKTYVGYHTSHEYGEFSQKVFHSNRKLDLDDKLIVISGDKSPMSSKIQYFLEGEFNIETIEDGDFRLGEKSFKCRFYLAHVSVPPEPIFLNSIKEFFSDIHKYYSNGTGISLLRSEHESVINALLGEHTEPSIRGDIEQVEKDEGISSTERRQLIDARLGQGKFRQEALKLWDNVCAVTGLSAPAMLVASHIKPWSLSNNKERLSADNGIILAPHLDKAFDRFLITFKDGGEIVINPFYMKDLEKIGITATMKIRSFPFLKEPTRNNYWEFHQNEFKKRNSAS